MAKGVRGSGRKQRACVASPRREGLRCCRHRGGGGGGGEHAKKQGEAKPLPPGNTEKVARRKTNKAKEMQGAQANWGQEAGKKRRGPIWGSQKTTEGGKDENWGAAASCVGKPKGQKSKPCGVGEGSQKGGWLEKRKRTRGGNLTVRRGGVGGKKKKEDVGGIPKSEDHKKYEQDEPKDLSSKRERIPWRGPRGVHPHGKPKRKAIRRKKMRMVIVSPGVKKRKLESGGRHETKKRGHQPRTGPQREG